MILHKDYKHLYSIQSFKKKTNKRVIIPSTDPIHPNNLFPHYLSNTELLSKWSALLDECASYLTYVFETPQLNLETLNNNCLNYITQLQCIYPLSLPDMLSVIRTFANDDCSTLSDAYDNSTLRSFISMLNLNLKFTFYCFILYSKKSALPGFTVPLSPDNFENPYWNQEMENFLVIVSQHQQHFPESLLKGRCVTLGKPDQK